MATAQPDAATQIDMYRRMSLITQNDEIARKSIRTGRLVMPYYPPKGQEAIPSGISVHLRDDDRISTIYRGTHDMLAKGGPLKEIWAEMAGRVTGTCEGRGGPMHVSHPETGVMVTTGIVGSSMPIANGLAWAARLDGSDRVSVAYFGDGASNIGAFHESLNMASVWKLPVIFVCQNNQFAEHTRFDKATSVETVAERAAAYNMPGVRIDGNDPFAVWEAGKEAIDRARDGQGPTLIEAVTFRFYGHVMGDDDSYMAEGEKAAHMEKDPTILYRQKLIDTGIATDADLQAIDDDVKAQIEEAVQFALDSDFPDPSTIEKHVMAEETA